MVTGCATCTILFLQKSETVAYSLFAGGTEKPTSAPRFLNSARYARSGKVVKWFDRKDFGFIMSNGERFFAHVSEVENYEMMFAKSYDEGFAHDHASVNSQPALKVGDEVTFELEPFDDVFDPANGEVPWATEIVITNYARRKSRKPDYHQSSSSPAFRSSQQRWRKQ